MKTIKYIISFFVLFVGVVIIGESHTFRLNNFYTEFDTTTLYLQPNTTEQEMIKDTVRSAAQNDVDMFTFVKSPRSTFLTDIEIYGTAGVEKYIAKNLNIYAREYQSLFFGNTRIVYHDFKDISGIENIHDFYVIGSNEKVKRFKIDLIDKYAGNHPEEGYVSNELRNTIFAIWTLMVSIILLLTYYDVMYQKKENLIRVSMGEQISRIIWRNILCDTFVFITLFAIIFATLFSYTHVVFGLTISLSFFGFLLLANSLLYINFYYYNLKEVFSNAKAGSRKLLTLNYSLKLVTVVITIFVISGNVALIFESHKLYRQKSFFEAHQDYFYIQLVLKTINYSDGTYDGRHEETDKLQETFYQQFLDKSDALLLASTDGLLREKGTIANRNAFEYLASKIKEIRGLELNKDIYFFVPKELEGDTAIIDEFKESVRFYEGNDFTYNYEMIYYDDTVDILRIDENHVYGSEFIENPIIIYYNSDKITNHITYSSEIMYKITDDEFNRFVQEHQLAEEIVTKTNVLERYNKSWSIAQNILYMNFIFSIMVLLLEFIVILSIIKLEYEVNAIELSIKKVLGHSMIESNQKIISITIITTILSIVSSVIAAILLGLQEVYYLAAGGIVILILELMVITFYIRRVENLKIQKVLKGGNL